MADWHLDERAHVGDEHLDVDYVARYDRKSGYDPTVDIDALRRHGLTADSLVLDMGAGTGVFSAAVAPLCGEVIAVDASPAMTAALRSRIARDGLENVRVVDAGFLSYEHEGAPADFVFTRNALHQLPDFWKAIALDRIASILRPGAVLRVLDLVFDFEPDDANSAIDAWLAGAVTDPTVGYTAEELATHVRTEFSTYSWLFEAILERVGFEIVEQGFRRSAYGTYTCVRHDGSGTRGLVSRTRTGPK